MLDSIYHMISRYFWRENDYIWPFIRDVASRHFITLPKSVNYYGKYTKSLNTKK